MKRPVGAMEVEDDGSVALGSSKKTRKSFSRWVDCTGLRNRRDETPAVDVEARRLNTTRLLVTA